MQFTLATFALVAASFVSAQGVTSVIAPSSPAPTGCSSSYNGNFEISVVLPNKKRDVVEKRTTCGGSGTLVATLSGGVLHDAVGRIGAIVANHQFQFDGPPSQAGSIYTGGWSVCSNSSLALGGSAVFYQCLSGTFYNLYDQSIGGQCQQVLIQVIPCSVGGGVSAGADGQPTAASAVSQASQISDGQVQATSAVTMVSQISDGQIQATSAVTMVSQISDGQIQASSAVPVVPVSQYTDGQIQATAMATATPEPTVISQISDGQIQATSAVSPASSATPVAQITDGQIQASVTTTLATATGAPAPTNGTTTTAATSPIFSGGASYVAVGSHVVLGAAAFVAVAIL